METTSDTPPAKEAEASAPSPATEAVPEKKLDSGGGRGKKRKNKRGKKKEESKVEPLDREGEEGSSEDRSVLEVFSPSFLFAFCFSSVLGKAVRG